MIAKLQNTKDPKNERRWTIDEKVEWEFMDEVRRIMTENRKRWKWMVQCHSP